MKKHIILILATVLLASACNQKTTNQTSSPIAQPSSTTTPVTIPEQPKLVEPITDGLSRVTKKFFGTYVTPQNSPVQPEKFTGFHTGIDFETTPAEATTDVPIYAACDGKLLVKEYASGYGGVAVQSCKIDAADVTIIYGHLRLSSITPKVGAQLKAGQQIAVLGTGYSTETDGERKHLHFAIHKGTSINILGYVQKQSDLSGWLDPEQYLK